ncbi:hypothetical protein [uncultured Aquimarina sp.]|uniref:hypothetical protein n=1 Tax=uncultured Aquimarina sp. TaxID=575652 RepID=UPI002605E6E2|nr:hypothetical protein [uncultured Aquimarina sp.]
MKKITLKLSLIACSFVFITSCQKEEIETPEIQNSSNPKQFVTVKDVSNEQETMLLLEELQKKQKNETSLMKRVGCTLDSDIGCGSDAALEIEEYINASGCISYPVGVIIFPIEAQQFTYNYSYYIDGDSDINMDRYQFQFEAHIADIQRQIRPKKISFINADASNRCFNERGWNVDNVVYTVFLGN